jgi:DNA-binding NarL/FixJ family response regulator
VADVVRVALCDDHAVVRSGLRRILDAEEDLEVVGEARTVKEAIALAAETHPDVFVMDLGLPDGNGITATAEIGRVSPDTRVLVLTVHDDVAYLRGAFDAGAGGYLVKEAADLELVQAVRPHPRRTRPPRSRHRAPRRLGGSVTLRTENTYSARMRPAPLGRSVARKVHAGHEQKRAHHDHRHHSGPPTRSGTRDKY